jgi:hypothetical protein
VSPYSLAHLEPDALLRDLASLVKKDRVSTAVILAHLAEVEARRLYRPAGYSSMFAYCVGELGMSEDATGKRIHAARAARRFPILFHAVADGRLHLTAVTMVAHHLAGENVEQWVAAAAHKTRAQIQILLAERFPQPDLPTRLEAVPAQPTGDEHAPAHLAGSATGLGTEQVMGVTSEHAPEHVAVNAGAGPTPSLTIPAVEKAPSNLEAPGAKLPPRVHAPAASPAPSGQTEPPAARPRITPLSPGRFAFQGTLSRATHEKLLHARSLLGHVVPSGDLDEVLSRVLDLAIPQLERRKFGSTDRPRRRSGAPVHASAGRANSDRRYIPADIRRAVSQRDQGRCTFVSASGHRCEERTRLELDHIKPLACGGETSVENLRLLCRAHNQHAAERAYGAKFMDERMNEIRRRTQLPHMGRLSAP